MRASTRARARVAQRQGPVEPLWIAISGVGRAERAAADVRRRDFLFLTLIYNYPKYAHGTGEDRHSSPMWGGMGNAKKKWMGFYYASLWIMVNHTIACTVRSRKNLIHHQSCSKIFPEKNAEVCNLDHGCASTVGDKIWIKKKSINNLYFVADDKYLISVKIDLEYLVQKDVSILSPIYPLLQRFTTSEYASTLQGVFGVISDWKTKCISMLFSKGSQFWWYFSFVLRTILY